MIFETLKINDFCLAFEKVRFIRKKTLILAGLLNAFHSFTEITACFRGFRLLLDGKLVGRGKLPFEQSRSGKPAVRCTKNLGMSGTIGLPHPLFFGKRGFRLLERQARGAG